MQRLPRRGLHRRITSYNVCYTKLLRVRELAREAGLGVAEKGESMEVCFVDGPVREFVEREAAANPERFGTVAASPAAVRTASGATLGEAA